MSRYLIPQPHQMNSRGLASHLTRKFYDEQVGLSEDERNHVTHNCLGQQLDAVCWNLENPKRRLDILDFNNLHVTHSIAIPQLG